MDIVERLKEQAVGREEWRVANPSDGSYVISFSWGDTLSPERDAREWLADHLARNPTSWVAGYEVRKVMAQSDADMLMIDAADEIARLRDENESLRGSLEEWRLDLNGLRDENAKLRENAERYRWIREYGGVNTMVRCDRMGSYIPKRHALDAAIDAAMQKGE